MQLGDGPVFERLPERQPQDLKGEAVAQPSALQCHSFPPVGVIGDLNPERNHGHQWVDLDCFTARAWPGTLWHQDFRAHQTQLYGDPCYTYRGILSPTLENERRPLQWQGQRALGVEWASFW